MSTIGQSRGSSAQVSLLYHLRQCQEVLSLKTDCVVSCYVDKKLVISNLNLFTLKFVFFSKAEYISNRFRSARLMQTFHWLWLFQEKRFVQLFRQNKLLFEYIQSYIQDTILSEISQGTMEPFFSANENTKTQMTNYKHLG